MEIKLGIIGNEYVIIDCEKNKFIGKKCQVMWWDAPNDLERYFNMHWDNQNKEGILFNPDTGQPIGVLFFIIKRKEKK